MHRHEPPFSTSAGAYEQILVLYPPKTARLTVNETEFCVTQSKMPSKYLTPPQVFIIVVDSRCRVRRSRYPVHCVGRELGEYAS